LVFTHTLFTIAEKTAYYILIKIRSILQTTNFQTIMNKAGLAEKLSEVLDGTKAQSERAVDVVVDTIIDTLKSGDEVSIAGLGIFSTKMRAARQGRNPRTGESIQIQAMRVPKFRAAKGLKDAVK